MAVGNRGPTATNNETTPVQYQKDMICCCPVPVNDVEICSHSFSQRRTSYRRGSQGRLSEIKQIPARVV